MAKILLVWLTLALILVSAAGCVGGSTSATGSTPVATAPVGTTAKESVPTTVPTVVPSTATAAVKTPTTAAKASPTTTSNNSGSGDDLLNKMKNIKSFTADFTINNDGEETTGKMTYSGNKMRMDVVQYGETLVFLIDGGNKTSYIYNPKEKKALYMPYDQGKTGEAPGDLLGWETNSTVPPKILGQETVDGKACTIYEFTTDTSKSKVWIDKSNGFPIKYDSTEDGKKSSTHFTKIAINGKVDEKLLVLPEGTEILDMTELMAPTATPGAKASPPAVSSTPFGTLLPAAITGAVPDELKTNVQIPSGFTLVRDTGQSEENVNTGVWKASAKWSGSASPVKVADFYAGFLAGKWQSQGKIISDLNIDLDYKKIGTDPEITLNVVAVVEKGNTVLTLTIANGDPNYYP